MGGSRGGSPTYLAKIRDSFYLGEQHQIDRAIVTIGSVTDFLLSGTEEAPGIKEACLRYIDDDFFPQDPEDHYYLEDYNVFARVIDPYLRGEFGGTHQQALWNARKRLFRSSPRWFANYLTNVQFHHGLVDKLARPTHSENLRDLLGPYEEITECHLYSGQDHSIDNIEDDYWYVKYEDAIKHWLNLAGGYPD